jgi:hypothetical protein
VIVDFTAEVWVWNARRTDTWTFVSLPVDESDRIRDLAGGVRRGFGSLRVRVRLGTSTWTTSIFPGDSGAYALPVKKAVRTAESLNVGDTAAFTIELLDL